MFLSQSLPEIIRLLLTSISLVLPWRAATQHVVFQGGKKEI
jgi:hypothetical protein